MRVFWSTVEESASLRLTPSAGAWIQNSREKLIEQEVLIIENWENMSFKKIICSVLLPLRLWLSWEGMQTDGTKLEK